MKSAGKWTSNWSWFSNGAWYCAKGIEPESNHTSMTSGTRRISSPHSGQANAHAQVLDQVGVSFLDEASGIGPDALVEAAVQAHGVHDVQPLLLAQPEVVLAEGDRRVHQAGAVLGGDEVGRQHGVALRPV